MGGRFTLSDDSHGVEQVGANYGKVLDCVRQAGITQLCHLVPATGDVTVHDHRFPNVGWMTVPLDEVEGHQFWKLSKQNRSR